MFASLPEEEKDALRSTCFAPLLLIDPIAMMLTLVVEIFDRHLGDMKFQFGGTIIKVKLIHVYLIFGLCVSSITNEFLFVDPEHITNFRMRRFPKKKNIYGLKEINGVLKQAKLKKHHDDVLRLNLLKIILSFLLPNKGRNVEERYVNLRHHIEVPAIGAAPAIKLPTVGRSTVGVPVIVRDSTLPLRNTLLLGQYQFSTPEKTMKRKREEEGNEKEDGKRKNAESRTWQETSCKKIKRLKRKKKNGDKKDDEDDDDEKDFEEKVKSIEEEQPQVAKEEEVQETMVATEVAKTDIILFNQDEVIGKAYQFVYLLTKESKEEVEQSKEKGDVDEASQVIDVYIKALIQYFDIQHRACEADKKIIQADVFSYQYIGRAFNV
ncbi:hypothetical protein GIB67_022939 [Kingdonia uniflora]|uniref:Uncharacterized protein n=1 Tax=Kingdonia uniflora TaxID=39325 RepID=A0A7J7P2L7_9MAGN|nr:hypothetical protein GIB67_022939 [Kingdonia uniflora]